MERDGFNPRLFRVRYVVDRGAVEEVFLQIFLVFMRELFNHCSVPIHHAILMWPHIIMSALFYSGGLHL